MNKKRRLIFGKERKIAKHGAKNIFIEITILVKRNSSSISYEQI